MIHSIRTVSLFPSSPSCCCGIGASDFSSGEAASGGGVIPFLVQLWMFATPTVYMRPAPDGTGSGLVQALLALNPLTGLIAAFRASVLGTPIPWASLGVSSIAVLCVCLFGCYYYRKVEDSFADII
jgi:lipopolysaccharide transport system permease protein